MKRRNRRSTPSRSARLAAQVHRFLGAAVIAAFATSASAQLQFAELGKRGLPASEDFATTTALGDVDGDGDLDLVVGKNGQSHLFLNNATGTFADVTTSRMPVGNYITLALALGDVDQDGDLDLLLGNWNGQSRLYLNNGTGTFTDATATRMPVGLDSTTSLALGDVDGDSDLDLIAGNQGFCGLQGCLGGQSRLYLNDGTGTYTDATASRMPVGTYQTSSLALGDVDGDGDLDLVLGNFGQSRLFLNNGTGTFADATTTRMPVGLHDTRSLALGDVDGDGDLDLVVGNHRQQSRLYLNNGNGAFTDATASRMPVGLYDTRSLALGDVDGDGELDLVVGNHRQQSRLYLNNGNGTFTDATATRMPVGLYDTSSLALGDVDRDGDLDLFVGNAGQQSRLYLSNGAGTFSDATASRMPVGYYVTTSLALGDLDRDGDLDLILGNSGLYAGVEQSRLYLNDGTGTFSDATAPRLPAGNYTTTSLALGDVDGDGDLDLLVGNSGQQSRLYLNNGIGTFADATASRMPAGTYLTSSLALGDADGDGDFDLVLGNNGQSRLYLNNGTGTFSDVTATRLPTGNYTTTSLAFGDVDRDGDLDLVVGNNQSLGVQSRLYRNDGTGTFTDATATRMPAGSNATTSLALGDVDRDGDLDLVLGNGGSSGRQSRLYLNNGSGAFTDATSTRMPVAIEPTTSLALGDVDGDGNLDLVLGNGGSSGRQSRLYLNSGTGTFTDATASRMPVGIYSTNSVALGDVDQDGDFDLVLGNAEQSRLYVNLHRQLDATYILHAGRNYQLDVYSRYGPSTTTEIAFPFASTGTANIPLPPFGTLGIDPTQMIALPPFVVAQPAGIGSLTLPIPNLPILSGITIYTQALLSQQPVQDRLTNVISDVLLQ